MTRREYYDQFADRLGSLNEDQLNQLRLTVATDKRLTMAVDDALADLAPRLAYAPEEIRKAIVPAEETPE
jgi:hypothetical protein